MAAPEADLDPRLRVDWLGVDELGDDRPGRLGMTFLPGKHGASTRYPGRVYRRELGPDLVALREAGVRTLLLLVDDTELERWGDHSIVERGSTEGITIDRRPMPDGTAPASPVEMDEMLAGVASARARGDVAVACMGGVGRTGMVVACALVAAGLTAPEAISRVRVVRHPGAVETEEQVMFVHTYERHVAGAEATGKVAR